MRGADHLVFGVAAPEPGAPGVAHPGQVHGVVGGKFIFDASIDIFALGLVYVYIFCYRSNRYARFLFPCDAVFFVVKVLSLKETPTNLLHAGLVTSFKLA